MISNIYIGIDGGATKCKVRIEDEEANVLGTAVGGPANIGMSVDVAWKSILDTVNEALKSADLNLKNQNYRFHAGCGLAGTEVIEAVDDFLSRSHQFTSICLKSDAYTACLGAHGGKDGAIIIIGTGVIGMRIQGDEIVQVGGWGFPHGDEGGGAWLGMEATRLVMQAYDGRVEFSPLLKAILKKFNGDFYRFVAWANTAQSTEFAQIAPLVIEHIHSQDPWALTLIKQAGRDIDRIYEALENRAADKTTMLSYSLIGGVAPFVELWLGKKLHSKIVPVQADATVGAIYMMKSKVSKLHAD